MGLDLGRFRQNKNEEWLEWLSDDPVPASIRSKIRARAVQDASRPVVRRLGQQSSQTIESPTKAQDKAAAVSINISIPKFKKPKLQVPAKLKSLPKKYALIGSGVATLALISVIAVIAIPDKKAGVTDDKKDVLSKKTETPTFAYSLPKGEEDQAEGDVRYDPEKRVVNFKDSIGGVNIVVSQQPLPSAFVDDLENRVKKLAEDFAANEVLSTANPTAYLGTSERGPQTVIFAKKDLLVFIQSEKKIDNHDWAEYITNLQ